MDVLETVISTSDECNCPDTLSLPSNRTVRGFSLGSAGNGIGKSRFSFVLPMKSTEPTPARAEAFNVGPTFTSTQCHFPTQLEQPAVLNHDSQHATSTMPAAGIEPLCEYCTTIPLLEPRTAATAIATRHDPLLSWYYELPRTVREAMDLVRGLWLRYLGRFVMSHSKRPKRT
jgi:hypothetical protein